jgi:hypothetical protein
MMPFIGLSWRSRFRGRLLLRVRRRALERESRRPRPPKEHRVACPKPGGEPLYKMAALSVVSRRLPGMTQRKVLPTASVLLREYNGP